MVFKKDIIYKGYLKYNDVFYFERIKKVPQWVMTHFKII
jgi:hypothetical protein